MPVAEADSGLLYDATQKRRLADLYAPCFTLILQLRATDEFGDPAVLRRRIKDLLDEPERDASRFGLPGKAFREAKFALVAFIDATILSSNWSRKDYWIAKPLQLELYNSFDAGETFFDHLDELRTHPSENVEILEVYYLCMTLGFKGRYELYEQERLRIIIEETYDLLRRTPGMSLGALAPHGQPRGQIATEVRSKLPVWVIAAFAAGIGLLIYLGMFVYMNYAASSAADEITGGPAPIESTR